MAITIMVLKVLGAYHLYVIPSRCPNPFSQATQTCRVLPLSFFLWLVALHRLRLPLLLLSRQNEERQRKYPLWGDRAVSSPCYIISCFPYLEHRQSQVLQMVRVTWTSGYHLPPVSTPCFSAHTVSW